MLQLYRLATGQEHVSGSQKEHLREAESLRSNAGQRFSSLPKKSMSQNNVPQHKIAETLNIII